MRQRGFGAWTRNRRILGNLSLPILANKAGMATRTTTVRLVRYLQLSCYVLPQGLWLAGRDISHHVSFLFFSVTCAVHIMCVVCSCVMHESRPGTADDNSANVAPLPCPLTLGLDWLGTETNRPSRNPVVVGGLGRGKRTVQCLQCRVLASGPSLCYCCWLEQHCCVGWCCPRWGQALWHWEFQREVGLQAVWLESLVLLLVPGLQAVQLQ